MKDLIKSRSANPPVERGSRHDPLDWLRSEVDRLFDDVGHPTRRLFDWSSFSASAFPPVDVAEKDGKYRVTAEVAGFDPDSITVSCLDDALIIKGAVDEASESEDDGLIVSERHRGSFERRIPFPGPIDPDKIKAKFKNGALRITVPKAIDAREQVVAVEIEK